MNILDFLVEPLTLPFMLRAFVVTVLAAAVCALLSCWLVLLGWSLMGDAISHAVLPGVVLAYIFGAPFAVGAVVAALVAVTLIGGALTSVVALQIVGVVLVVAMLVIPGSTARLITDRFVPMLLVSVGVSLAGTLTGLYVSYHADISPGGAVVVTQGLLFALAYVFAPRYGVLGRMRARRLSVTAEEAETPVTEPSAS